MKWNEAHSILKGLAKEGAAISMTYDVLYHRIGTEKITCSVMVIGDVATTGSGEDWNSALTMLKSKLDGSFKTSTEETPEGDDGVH